MTWVITNYVCVMGISKTNDRFNLHSQFVVQGGTQKPAPNISQGSVATCLMFGGTCNHSFLTNLKLKFTVKELLKWAFKRRSYGDERYFWPVMYLTLASSLYTLVLKCSKCGFTRL